jgi:hypothetical protein
VKTDKLRKLERPPGNWGVALQMPEKSAHTIDDEIPGERAGGIFPENDL